MSALTEQLAAATTTYRRGTRLEQALDAMSTEDRLAVLEAVDSDISAPKLSAVLRSNGYEVSASSIKDLRRGDTVLSVEQLKDKYL